MEKSSSTTQTGGSILFMECLWSSNYKSRTKRTFARTNLSVTFLIDPGDVLSIGVLVVSRAGKSQTDRIQKRIFAERLEQAIYGTIFHHSGDNFLVSMSRDEDNRDSVSVSFQFPLQFGTTHSRHSYV